MLMKLTTVLREETCRERDRTHQPKLCHCIEGRVERILSTFGSSGDQVCQRRDKESVAASVECFHLGANDQVTKVIFAVPY